MELNDFGLLKSNKIHLMIKRLFNEDMDFIKRSGVEICRSCRGTGLSNYGATGNFDFHWTPGSFCKKCGSIGYVKLDKLFQETKDGINFLCRTCYGIGCDNCDDGYVDWIKHAKGY